VISAGGWTPVEELSEAMRPICRSGGLSVFGPSESGRRSQN
jgi:hypothetical protein